MAYNSIYQLVYLRYREGIFRTSLVKICEIFAHSSFFVLLPYYHSIG